MAQPSPFRRCTSIKTPAVLLTCFLAPRLLFSYLCSAWNLQWAYSWWQLQPRWAPINHRVIINHLHCYAAAIPFNYWRIPNSIFNTVNHSVNITPKTYYFSACSWLEHWVDQPISWIGDFMNSPASIIAKKKKKKRVNRSWGQPALIRRPIRRQSITWSIK